VQEPKQRSRATCGVHFRVVPVRWLASEDVLCRESGSDGRAGTLDEYSGAPRLEMGWVACVRRICSEIIEVAKSYWVSLYDERFVITCTPTPPW